MRGNSKASFAVAVLFCLGMTLPLVGMVFPSLNCKPGINELRRLATMPVLEFDDISSFPKHYESFFNDHFGYRNLFIRLHNLTKLKLFSTSGSPKVMIGKEGWLFYTGDDITYDYRRTRPLSIEDLKQWQYVLEKKQEWLSSQGIHYLFIVGPSKGSIYPEYLPFVASPVGHQTPLDQLATHLKNNSKVNIVDLREALITQKPKGLLYNPIDTHWTAMGAFLGYQEIYAHLEKIFPKMEPLTFDHLNQTKQRKGSGDLATMLGLQEDLKQTFPQYNVLMPKARRIGEPYDPADSEATFVMQTTEKHLPRGVMFRDSFTIALVPYLSENFSHIQYIWDKWDKETPIEKILKENEPDIVVEEWVERKIKFMNWVSISPLPQEAGLISQASPSQKSAP